MAKNSKTTQPVDTQAPQTNVSETATAATIPPELSATTPASAGEVLTTGETTTTNTQEGSQPETNAPVAPLGDDVQQAGATDPIPHVEETKVYAVLSPLKHDGTRYSIGGRIRMTETEAETLVLIGVLGDPQE